LQPEDIEISQADLEDVFLDLMRDAPDPNTARPAPAQPLEELA